jgi:hypothetical protein
MEGIASIKKLLEEDREFSKLMIIIIKYLKIKIIIFRNFKKNYNKYFNKMYYINIKE